ncbi:MAG: DUF4340 domain-containing protein [Planctomycetota bacterium]
MSEANKTLIFLGAAALSVTIAIATRPGSGEYDANVQLGQDIAKAFEPDEAKRLSITRYDEETATIEPFEVAEQGGVWTLPSKGGYPADAARQLAEAITGVTDREILGIAAEQSSEHEKFGVVDPGSDKLQPGQTGVGTRVTLAGEEEELVDLIIGEQVKDQDEQRYVRRADQDVVFVVEIDPSKFSTNFADWIEDDLLKINAWDLKRVRINDYSFDFFMTLAGPRSDADYRSEIELSYDDSGSKWNLDSLRVAADPKKEAFEEKALGEQEELNEDALRDLKSALDDLRIVDVSRKPDGLSADLQAGDQFLNDERAQLSLVTRGFTPLQRRSGELDLRSSEGEVIATMNDGVEYVLRFGNLQIDEGEEGEAADGEESAEAGDGEGDEESDEDSGVNRYLFVMVRFNESAIERPELEDVPPLPEGADTTDEAADDDDAEDTSAPAADAEGKADANDADAKDKDDDADADDEADSELAKVVAERKEIEERNARKLDEYEEQLTEGRDRVKELNARFGDWYYVVANETFKKIRLGRDDVIQEKEKDEEGDAEDAAAEPASSFGAPGAAVPGLPGFGSALSADPSAATDPDPQAAEEAGPEEMAAEEPTAEESPADAPAAEQPEAAESSEAGAAAEPAASEEPATESPAPETPDPAGESNPTPGSAEPPAE